jgi:hypothetical protein
MKTNTKKKVAKTNRTNRTPSKGRKARTRTGTWQNRFIAELRKRGIVADACKVARLSRSTAYEHKEADKAFAAQWQAALEDAADVMEGEAFRRAVKGVLEPVFYQGEEAGTVRRYSDSLLMFLLKGARPVKFRETTKVEHSGEIGVLTPEDIEKRRRERWDKVKPALSVALSQGIDGEPEGANSEA